MKRWALVGVVATGLLAACGGGGDDETPEVSSVATARPGNPQTVTLRTTDQLAFVPDEVAMAPGEITVTVANDGGTPHDFSLPAAKASIPTLQKGEQESATFTLTEPGEYEFVCTLHRGMTGRLVVARP